MNLRDLAAYLNAHLLQPEDFLKSDSWKTLHTPPFGGDYAMGWVVKPDGRLWHNGSNTFWYAEMTFDPAKKSVAAATCNDGVLAASQPAVSNLLDSALLAATQS